MSNVSIYKFENTTEIRVVKINGNPWFLSRDVLAALGFPLVSSGGHPISVTSYLQYLSSDEKIEVRKDQGGYEEIFLRAGQYRAYLISESGLYKLIMRSDKPKARRFQDWVTRDVLPAIRKDGAYIMGEEKVATGEMDEEAFILKAYEMLKRKVERLAQEKEQLSMENKEMAPKAVVFDNCVALRQESLATFVRTLEGVSTMAIITNHRSHSAASKSTASITGASTSGLKSFPYRLKVIPPL